jgi:hypothetical protein
VGIAYLWVEVCGHPAQPLAATLAVQPAVVSTATSRSAQEVVRWRNLLPRDRAAGQMHICMPVPYPHPSCLGAVSLVLPSYRNDGLGK